MLANPVQLALKDVAEVESKIILDYTANLKYELYDNLLSKNLGKDLR